MHVWMGESLSACQQYVTSVLYCFVFENCSRVVGVLGRERIGY